MIPYCDFMVQCVACQKRTICTNEGPFHCCDCGASIADAHQKARQLRYPKPQKPFTLGCL